MILGSRLRKAVQEKQVGAPILCLRISLQGQDNGVNLGTFWLPCSKYHVIHVMSFMSIHVIHVISCHFMSFMSCLI
jgi:hypothetical protein